MVPGDLSAEVKWPGREADHSSSASAEVKSDCTCTSHPVSLVFYIEMTLHCTKTL